MSKDTDRSCPTTIKKVNSILFLDSQSHAKIIPAFTTFALRQSFLIFSENGFTEVQRDNSHCSRESEMDTLLVAIENFQKDKCIRFSVVHEDLVGVCSTTIQTVQKLKTSIFTFIPNSYFFPPCEIEIVRNIVHTFAGMLPYTDKMVSFSDKHDDFVTNMMGVH